MIPQPEHLPPEARRMFDSVAAIDLGRVHHPSHYNSHPSGVECIQIAEHFNFCMGNAIKYLWRAGLKEGVDAVQDLEKARWYVDREIERRRGGQVDGPTAQGG